VVRTIDPASIRAYVARDWGLLRARKRAYWRARLDPGGLVEALAITEHLVPRYGTRPPSWPTEQEREEDLETHRRVAAALTRTSCPQPRDDAPRRKRRTRRVR
jgi:hypothetical protein